MFEFIQTEHSSGCWMVIVKLEVRARMEAL